MLIEINLTLLLNLVLVHQVKVGETFGQESRYVAHLD
jgi:hypothetical protein